MTRDDFGRHYLIDFTDCDPEVIQRVEPARSILLRALEACGATIITDTFHQFEPYGVSGIVLIAESHLGFHSWPEDRFAAVDIFTCGDMQPEIAVEMIRKEFRAGTASMHVATRGQLKNA